MEKVTLNVSQTSDYTNLLFLKRDPDFMYFLKNHEELMKKITKWMGTKSKGKEMVILERDADGNAKERVIARCILVRQGTTTFDMERFKEEQHEMHERYMTKQTADSYSIEFTEF